MSQFGLPFDWPADEDQSDFIVTTANDVAVRHLDRWGSWPVRATLLTGPRKSGKSLLGRIFAARSGGRLIDNADTRPEAELFHAWNAAQESRVPLLLVTENAPPLWDIPLPDLRSRMQATPIVSIDPPDRALAESLLAKLLAKRGLPVAPDVAAFVSARIERTYVAIFRAVDLLDEASLSQKRAITIPFVRDVLAHGGLIDREGVSREQSEDERGHTD